MRAAGGRMGRRPRPGRPLAGAAPRTSSQQACFGVWVTWMRGCAAIQARVAFEVCDDPLPMISRMVRFGGIDWFSSAGKPVKVIESLRSTGCTTTRPEATCRVATMDTVPLRT